MTTAMVNWYDLRICDDMNYLYSYAAESNIPQHTMLPYEDPVTPSPFWNSRYNTFELKIRVKDEVQGSDWEIKPITFRAFERPRVVEVSVPGEEYEPPVINLLATHEVIRHGTDGEELPVTKAGGRITILVDSIGKVRPNSWRRKCHFPYLTKQQLLRGNIRCDQKWSGEQKMENHILDHLDKIFVPQHNNKMSLIAIVTDICPNLMFRILLTEWHELKAKMTIGMLVRRK